MKSKLTKEEKETLDSFDQGEWVPVSDLSKRKKELIRYAQNTLRKDRRLNIRISERDLLELQRKAVKEGLPRKELSRDAVERLQAHRWPGNIRELENLLRRLVAIEIDDTISEGD